jgi:hypothetical protein
MATIAVSRKLPICREKRLGVHDSRPLVSGMDSSACTAFGKYCLNGGIAFAPNTAATQIASDCRAPGCPPAASWPLSWLPGSVFLQGKSVGVRDSRPLGAAMDSSASCSPESIHEGPSQSGINSLRRPARAARSESAPSWAGPNRVISAGATAPRAGRSTSPIGGRTGSCRRALRERRLPSG